MLVNGEAVEKGELVPGHVMQFPGELSLLCVARARTMAPHEYFPADALGDFGEPDAYGMIGESAAMQALRERIARDAASANHVLLVGESGTGKELAARAIHALSDRRRRALVTCNAGSVPPKLVYTEFFGNLRDYPNAGMPARIGYFATADKAFLFVDEITRAAHRGPGAPSCARSPSAASTTGWASPRAAPRTCGSSGRPTATPTMRRRCAGTCGLGLRSSRFPPLRERREDIPLLVRHLARELAKKCSAERRGRLFVEYRGRLEVKMDLESLERLVRMPLRLCAAVARDPCGWRSRRARGMVVIEPGVGMEAAGDEAGADGGENPADAGGERRARQEGAG